MVIVGRLSYVAPVLVEIFSLDLDQNVSLLFDLSLFFWDIADLIIHVFNFPFPS